MNAAQVVTTTIFFAAIMGLGMVALESVAEAGESGGGVVAATAADIRPLVIGSPLPEVELRNIAGEKTSLGKLLENGPLVLAFYRGGWCPYCNRQLAGLQQVEGTLKSLGYRILAISPDKPEKLKESVGKNELTYTLLSDSGMAAAKAFGIAFQVDDETLLKLKGYNIDLEAASGEKHHGLPVPAVFIIGQDGLIRFAYANPDYKVRLDIEVLLAAARAGLEKEN